MADAAPVKKRHHYVPITYLDGFTDDRGRLQVYLCDQHQGVDLEPKPIAPNNIAFRNYYYAQTDPDTGLRSNRIEDLFDEDVETHWPNARDAARQDNWTPESWAHLYLMLASLRVRVPAAREMIETALASGVRMAGDKLDRDGRLPPMPAGLEDLWSRTDISIDPQQSLLAMPRLLESVQAVVASVGFEVLHNRTGRPFITSDNPVSWFDPRTPEARQRPYQLNAEAIRAEIVFPIDAWTLLRGTTALRNRDYSGRPGSRVLTDERAVRGLNRITARFAYRLMFAPDRQSDRLIRLYGSTSPVLRTATRRTSKGDLLLMQTVFGPRPQLPRWTGE